MLFIVGHIAIKFLVHIDDIENHIKRLKNEVETKKQKNKNGEDDGDELDKIGGGIEADFERKIEYLHKVGESTLVNNPKSMLGYFLPVM